MNLQWNDIHIDGYPLNSNKPCFIIVNNELQIAYWFRTVKRWNNRIYGWLPHIYEDNIVKWAYIPDELLKISPIGKCFCYHENLYNDGYDRCYGTKEIEVCNCKGEKSRCDFY